MATTKIAEALAEIETELEALATVKAALLQWSLIKGASGITNGARPAEAVPVAPAPAHRRRRTGSPFLSETRGPKGRKIGEVKLNLAKFLGLENDWVDYSEAFSRTKRPEGKRFNRERWRHLVTAHMGSLVRSGYAQTEGGRGNMRIRLTPAGRAWLLTVTTGGKTGALL